MDVSGNETALTPGERMKLEAELLDDAKAKQMNRFLDDTSKDMDKLKIQSNKASGNTFE